MRAVTLPLEIQMKDHKQQLQSRLDNLSKINEKSTGINEQLAELKAVGEGLQKQREMIEGLLQRVSREEAVAAAAPSAAVATRATPRRSGRNRPRTGVGCHRTRAPGIHP